MVYRRVRGLTLALSLGAISCASSEPEGGRIGDPCSTQSDCTSDICIFVDGGGLCSGACTEGCPSGWGCFGVRDVVEPGTVSEICVPESPNLCSTCGTDNDCAVTGNDWCLTDSIGKKFCGRDCTSVGCPEGFECTDIERGALRSKQCVPISQSCDCGDAEANSTEDCVLETFNGDCPGIRTCQGGIGWSECGPRTDIDVPDAMFADENCDGIDGTLDDSILVSRDGEDTETCGLTTDDPCRNINHAIGIAAAAGRHYVLVQQGLYNEAVRMADGVSVFGGYNAGWRRGPHTESLYRVEILGALDGTDNEFATFIAVDLVEPTTIGDLFITGPQATGQRGNSGRSSYAIYARNADNLIIERVDITAGDGADGADGSNGANAAPVNRLSSMNGGQGGASAEFSTACNNTDRGGGGARGTNSCPNGRDPEAGPGGRGGFMDTDCGIFSFDPDATAGGRGGNARVVVVNDGRGGSGGSGGNDCGPVGDGRAGDIANGAGGIGASAGGFVSGNFWRTRSGNSGSPGQNGGGGGGGGGSGGCDDGIDSYGAGGGGGGAGGCAAQSAGGGGFGGGSSFGIFALDSVVTASDCSITRGNGGDGGRGGIGGRGQSGGLGGPGGTSTNDSRPGGDGGDGAHGGHGGGGGGGSGGHAAAIARRNGTVTHDCSLAGGGGGAAGAGGASAPTAPPLERDGNAGSAGDPGTVFDIMLIP